MLKQKQQTTFAFSCVFLILIFGITSFSIILALCACNTSYRADFAPTYPKACGANRFLFSFTHEYLHKIEFVQTVYDFYSHLRFNEA